MINLKLSKSSGSGNSVPHVFGRFSSFMSRKKEHQVREKTDVQKAYNVAQWHCSEPFVILSCAADAFFWVPALGDSPSFFACFNENNLIIVRSRARRRRGLTCKCLGHGPRSRGRHTKIKPWRTDDFLTPQDQSHGWSPTTLARNHAPQAAQRLVSRGR